MDASTADLSTPPDSAEPDGAIPDRMDASDVTVDRDETADSTVADVSDSTVADTPDSTVADTPDSTATDRGAPTDTGSSPDARSDRDAGDVPSCAIRAMPGACTPGPGCDIVDVAISGLSDGVGPCVVFTGGSVRCWGRGINPPAYLGRGTSVCSSPGLVPHITEAENVQQGANFACVVRSGSPRRTWCWGNNAFLQMGGGLGGTGEPTMTNLPSGTLTLGGQSGFSIEASGVVYAWGKNDTGQLGDGTASAPGAMGVAVHEVSLPGLRQVALSSWRGQTACGVFTGGVVRCWGLGSQYQFGTAVTPVSFATVSHSPVTVPGISGAREVRLSENFVCALRTDDSVWCWGNGYRPEMRGSGGTPTEVLDRTTQIVVASAGACALRTDGTVWCWGEASEVGNGGAGLVPNPEQVRGLTGVRRIYAGGGTRCAWRGGADLWCWGQATGTATRAGNSAVPVPVPW